MGKSHDLATLKGGGTIDGEVDVTSGGYTARGLARLMWEQVLVVCSGLRWF